MLVIGRSRAAAADRRARTGAVLRPAHAASTQIHLGSAPTWSSFVFALTITDDRVHERRVGRRAGRRGADRRAARCAGWSPAAPRTVVRRLRRHRGGRGHRAARARRSHRAGRPLPERPGDRDRHCRCTRTGSRRALRYLVGALATADADRGRQLGDAGALAAGLLALDQPPDPQRARSPAPDSARRRMC